jgi:uncharacterized surface protein with fasciclin (FAS1) repeats
MTRTTLLVSAALALSLAACHKGGDTANNAAATAQTKPAAKAAGSQTIATGLIDDQRFVAAIKAAGMDPVFAGPGPYTVLVPTDAAFAKLTPSARDALMAPGGKAKLVRFISHHVLPGTILTADIVKAIDAHGGKATLATMAGGTLTATRSGAQIGLTDAGGGTAAIVGTDSKRSNGVIDHIDTVLHPHP